MNVKRRKQGYLIIESRGGGFRFKKKQVGVLWGVNQRENRKKKIKKWEGGQREVR